MVISKTKCLSVIQKNSCFTERFSFEIGTIAKLRSWSHFMVVVIDIVIKLHCAHEIFFLYLLQNLWTADTENTATTSLNLSVTESNV